MLIHFPRSKSHARVIFFFGSESWTTQKTVWFMCERVPVQNFMKQWANITEKKNSFLYKMSGSAQILFENLNRNRARE